ncbi:MAG: NADPH-dependent curcumin reductase CurA [Halioglobus sp.]|jgi:NADPH-dependent curcumin reductase CurA
MNQTLKNQHILLAARPKGEIKHSDFEVVDEPIPSPGEGEVLVQVHHLAVEPAMKGWMEARVDYVTPLQIGDVMRGHGAGVVLESNHPDFPVGATVTGPFGWRRYFVGDGKAIPLRTVPDNVEQPAALNVLGITGITAFFGMLEIGNPQPGQTVLVSGAAGATGSVAGQLARIAGARVVGIAGGKEKCDWLVDALGFDAAIDYKSDDTAAQVKLLCPDGVDVFYDNVGGEILDIALANLANGARIVLCGGISRYNETGHIAGPSNYFNLVYRRARMEGFIVVDYVARFPEAIEALERHLASGELRHHETILQGFDQMPQALMNLFSGANKGKQLVKLDI